MRGVPEGRFGPGQAQVWLLAVGASFSYILTRAYQNYVSKCAWWKDTNNSSERSINTGQVSKVEQLSEQFDFISVKKNLWKL